MSTILSELKKNVKLSPSEELIAQYISSNIDEIPNLSSRELARRTFTSSSAVLRFVRKLGFQSYNDFRLHIVASLKDMPLADLAIIGNEDCLTMVSKMTELEEKTIERTRNLLSPAVLSGACNAICSARTVDFIASDANAALAEYAAHSFLFLGKTATVYRSSDTQLFSSLLADQSHIAIIITKYGETRFINNAARKLAERKVPTIAIISSKDRFLEKICDYTFLGVIDPQFKFIGDIQFGISAKYILDLLYASVFSRSYQKSDALAHEYQKLFHRSK